MVGIALEKHDPAWAGDKDLPKADRKKFAEKLLSQDVSDLAEAQELVSIGAYVQGASPGVDRALGLRAEIEAFLRQTSDERAPWGTGPHPYLVAGDGRVDDWTLELPAEKVLAVTPDRLIPTELVAVDGDEPERFDFRSARRIASAAIDHAYTDLTRDASGLAVVRVTNAGGQGVEMSWDAACPWVQIHTADRPGLPVDRIGLAVEPMTCAPDAFNADAYSYDAGLIVLEAGAEATASWRIAAIANGLPSSVAKKHRVAGWSVPSR